MSLSACILIANVCMPFSTMSRHFGVGVETKSCVVSTLILNLDYPLPIDLSPYMHHRCQPAKSKSWTKSKELGKFTHLGQGQLKLILAVSSVKSPIFSTCMRFIDP